MNEALDLPISQSLQTSHFHASPSGRPRVMWLHSLLSPPFPGDKQQLFQMPLPWCHSWYSLGCAQPCRTCRHSWMGSRAGIGQVSETATVPWPCPCFRWSNLTTLLRGINCADISGPRCRTGLTPSYFIRRHLLIAMERTHKIVYKTWKTLNR